MQYTLIPLNELDETGLNRLTALHLSVMHTLLSDLGEPIVHKYYEIAKRDPSVLGKCAFLPDGEIAGWVMGSPNPAALYSRLRQPLGWFACQLSHLLVRHPRVIFELLRSVTSDSDANQLSANQIELTYIGVAPKTRGQGMGTALLNTFTQLANQSGYNSIALSVETDNHQAVDLYKRNGFLIKKTYHEGRFERHRMVCLAKDFSVPSDNMKGPGSK